MQRGGTVLLGQREREDLAAFRREQARHAGIGEEAGRPAGADQHDTPVGLEYVQRLRHRIRDAVDGEPSGAALQPRVHAFGHDVAARRRGDGARRLERLLEQRASAEQQQCRLAAFQDGGGCVDEPVVHHLAFGDGGYGSDRAAVAPGRVGGQDQGRDLPRRGVGSGDCLRGAEANRCGVGRRFDPMRDRTRDARDIRGERCVVLDVIGRMLADDVDDGRARLLRIVQVGQRVAEARPKVQQGRRGFSGHSGIAVGGAADDAFEQAEDAAHAVDLVERRHEMHLRGARICETDVDAALQQRMHQALGSVH